MYNYSEKCVKAHKEQNRKRHEQAEAKYRRLFSDLGHDEAFEFIFFEGNNRIRVKCKRCGLETTRDTGIFKGKQSKLLCRSCGNGMILYSPFVDEVLAYYQAGHSVKETCEKFDVKEFQLNDWAKRRKVTNGRSFGSNDSNKGKKAAQVLAQKTFEARKKAAVEKIEARGFEYIDGFIDLSHWVTVRCKTCGETSKRSMEGFKVGSAICRNCKKIEAEARKEEEQRQREEKQKQKEATRALINPLGLSPYQLEREKKLDEVRVCKVCGKQYTIREYVKSAKLKTFSNAGFCSDECKRKETRKKERERRKELGIKDSHRARCRRFGCPYDPTVTTSALIKKEGLFCKICGLICDPNANDWSPYMGALSPTLDHIIPLAQEGSPGHVWSNVQVAHAICNSVKSDKARREDGKYETNKKSRRTKSKETYKAN